MPSLYDAGWRQGSVFVATLPFDAVIVDREGQIARQVGERERWAVASQECDLDQTDADDPLPTIELRAVYTHEPPDDWGIRSARFRLSAEEYVVASDPRQSVSAQVLSSVLRSGARQPNISAARCRAFAVWLGLRYDRPALHPELVALARSISDEVRRRSGRVVASNVRDVLMVFADTAEPARYSLFAVLDDEADEACVREWLAGVASRVPKNLGIAEQLEAATADRISFQLIEQSYAADATQLTWPAGTPEPRGAE